MTHMHTHVMFYKLLSLICTLLGGTHDVYNYAYCTVLYVHYIKSVHMTCVHVFTNCLNKVHVGTHVINYMMLHVPDSCLAFCFRYDRSCCCDILHSSSDTFEECAVNAIDFMNYAGRQ